MKNHRLSGHKAKVKVRKFVNLLVEIAEIMHDLTEDINMGIPNHKYASKVFINAEVRRDLRGALTLMSNNIPQYAMNTLAKMNLYESLEEDDRIAAEGQ